MSRAYPTSVLLIVFSFLTAPGVLLRPTWGAAPVEPPPSMDEIKTLAKTGDAATALKKISQALALKGDAAAGYDRYELLTLKGEAHLRQKQAEPAAAAFVQAGKETKDPKQIAVAKANELLIHRSRAFAYTPRTSDKTDKSAKADTKTTKAEAIDIIDPEKRKSAMEALLADESAAITPKIEAAKKGNSLSPIADAMKSAAGVHALDVAVHDNDDQTKRLLGDLRDHGKDLMTKGLDKMAKQVDDIEQAPWGDAQTARQTVTPRNGRTGAKTGTNTGTGTMDGYYPRGPSPANMQALKSVIDNCTKISQAAQSMAEASGGSKDDVSEIVKQADDLKKRSEKLLKGDRGKL